MRVVVLIAAAWLSLGSVQSRSSYRAKTADAPLGVTDADLYAAAVRVFSDHDWALRDKDRDAGLVATEWVVVDSVLGVTQLHSWRASITDGELRLSIDCETIADGSRAPCGYDKRVQPWIDTEPTLREEIFSEASRRARNRHREERRNAAPKPDGGVSE